MQNNSAAEEKMSNQDNQQTLADQVTDPKMETTESTVQGNQSEDSPLSKLTNELAEQKDKYLRLYSDFENFRRRSAKEKVDFIRSASEEVIVTLLPVVDDFERALSAHDRNKDDSVFAEGIKLIYSKLYKALEQKGLKPIDAKGKDFDIELHEAITQIPSDDSQKGKVIEVVEKGYYLNDKVIRFAKVVIGF